MNRKGQAWIIGMLLLVVALVALPSLFSGLKPLSIFSAGFWTINGIPTTPIGTADNAIFENPVHLDSTKKHTFAMEYCERNAGTSKVNVWVMPNTINSPSATVELCQRDGSAKCVSPRADAVLLYTQTFTSRDLSCDSYPKNWLPLDLGTYNLSEGNYFIVIDKDAGEYGTRNVNNPKYFAVSVHKPILSPANLLASPAFTNILTKIADWFKSLWNLLPFTITGATSVQPNTQQTYAISLTAAVPDSNYEDGSFQAQWANWALIDKNTNILQQGTWEQVAGSFTKSVTLTTPSNLNDFVFIATIYQYDYSYDSATNKWNIVKEEVVAKDALNLKTKVSIAPSSLQPTTTFFSGLINSLLSWFKGIFGL